MSDGVSLQEAWNVDNFEQLQTSAQYQQTARPQPVPPTDIMYAQAPQHQQVKSQMHTDASVQQALEAERAALYAQQHEMAQMQMQQQEVQRRQQEAQRGQRANLRINHESIEPCWMLLEKTTNWMRIHTTLLVAIIILLMLVLLR